jgi:hypothetical protein
MHSTRHSRQILMKLERSPHIFEKHSNLKFHKNPSIRSRVVPYGRTDGRTDTTKLIVAFRNFVNAPKKNKKGWTIRNCFKQNFNTKHQKPADPAGRAVQGASLKPLDCWDRGFESR